MMLIPCHVDRMPDGRVYGVDHTVGDYRVFRLHVGRVGLGRPREPYGQATFDVGPWGLVQFHAWANTRGACGSYWTLWRGHWSVLIGGLARHGNGGDSGPFEWSLSPTLRLGEYGDERYIDRWRIRAAASRAIASLRQRCGR